MAELETVLKAILKDVTLFAAHASGLRLRSYQREVARTIADSVINRKGLSIVVVFPRQSGKNELQAQVETYLLTLFSLVDAEIVKVSPTWKPQTLNAMRRLQRVLERNLITRGRWAKEAGYIYRVGKARIFFLSGGPQANVVGATASTLLECDEAQDVTIAKWDKDFAPMAASTNATRVFWGTTWTSRTLLARELRAAREAEKRDGQRRVFMIQADEVAQEVPAYGEFVGEQVAKLGRNHPLVKTQFFSEEIDAEGGMFPPARRALMQGSHERRCSPEADKMYAMLLDVAGQDEAATDQASFDYAQDASKLQNAGRDATALTVVEVDLSTLEDELIQAPTYRVAYRDLWVGVKHTMLYGQIKALAEHWGAKYLVVDATGVGAGLASFLDKALPKKVIPFVFTQKSKSDLGWEFLAVIETGRYKEYQAKDDPHQAAFWKQVEYCQSAVVEGPGKLLRWGVPDGTRDAEGGELVHDDLLISAALCALLDKQEWGLGKSTVIESRDILANLKEAF